MQPISRFCVIITIGDKSTKLFVDSDYSEVYRFAELIHSSPQEAPPGTIVTVELTYRTQLSPNHLPSFTVIDRFKRVL